VSAALIEKNRTTTSDYEHPAEHESITTQVGVGVQTPSDALCHPLAIQVQEAKEAIAQPLAPKKLPIEDASRIREHCAGPATDK